MKKPGALAEQSGREGIVLMDIVQRTHPIRQTSADRERRRAKRALEVALSQHCNGGFSTLAWCASGMPRRGIDQRVHDFYQQARRIVHANGGRLHPGDVEKLMATMRGRVAR
jgi:hypothetical protein